MDSIDFYSVIYTTRCLLEIGQAQAVKLKIFF